MPVRIRVQPSIRSAFQDNAVWQNSLSVLTFILVLCDLKVDPQMVKPPNITGPKVAKIELEGIYLTFLDHFLQTLTIHPRDLEIIFIISKCDQGIIQQ